MKKTVIYTILLLCNTVLFQGCDSTISPADSIGAEPIISRLEITPQNLQFSSLTDGVKDTTIMVDIEAEILNLTDSLPMLSLIDRSTELLFLQQNMERSQIPQIYTLQVPLQTRTTYFNEYRVIVTAVSEMGRSTYAVASLNYKGFSEAAPQILSVTNPDSVTKPADNTDLYPFTAKVTDIEGQDTIEGVFVRIINPVSGEVNNSPFQLFDDGTNGEDITARDSVYTITFPVDPESQAQTFDLLFYAVDKGGLTSDTLTTQFTITN